MSGTGKYLPLAIFIFFGGEMAHQVRVYVRASEGVGADSWDVRVCNAGRPLLVYTRVGVLRRRSTDSLGSPDTGLSLGSSGYKNRDTRLYKEGYCHYIYTRMGIFCSLEIGEPSCKF